MSSEAQSGLLAVPGVRLGVAIAGIKPSRRKPDLLLLELPAGSSCAAVYTRNTFCAAPILVARAHEAEQATRYLLVNSGNANAGTGQQGHLAAIECCQAVAELASCDAEAVLPFSTGVIGEQLPVARIIAALPEAFAGLNEQGWDKAAQAIMTTDTRPKAASRQFVSHGVPITVTGIAKGSGMICPDMATMLSYIATDMPVAPAVLQACLDQAVKVSFNRITVDGDTSTNDACVLMASGQADHEPVDQVDSEAAEQLFEAVTELSIELAQAIVRDGEGATKFITVIVNCGKDRDECRQVAYTIAHSPLVKTAFFASDPNWGRILAAVGRSGLAGLDVGQVDIFLDDVGIVAGGEPAADYTEAVGAEVMRRGDITIRVELGRGAASEQIWTTDLSYDYVRINAEYRS